MIGIYRISHMELDLSDRSPLQNDSSNCYFNRDTITVVWNTRSSRPEVFLGKGVLKLCSKFTVEHPCQSVISINSQSNFIEITLRHGCSPVNLLHFFRTPFPKNSSGRLLLEYPFLHSVHLQEVNF